MKNLTYLFSVSPGITKLGTGENFKGRMKNLEVWKQPKGKGEINGRSGGTAPDICKQIYASVKTYSLTLLSVNQFPYLVNIYMCPESPCGDVGEGNNDPQQDQH